MSIFSGDVVIKTCIEEGLEDMIKNPWLIEDCLDQFTKNAFLAKKYGQKEIDAAKEWFKNNKIDVNMQYRLDKSEFPSMTVAMLGSSEIKDLDHLGDLSTEVETLMPNQIGKPIPYMVKPFVPTGYDSANGLVYTPTSVNLGILAPGMVLVNPDNGEGFIILGIGSDHIEITPDLDITASRFAIVPQYPFYRARREHAFFNETYSIGCHVAGDPFTLLWLHAAVCYILMRYREALLEGRNFSQSSISSSDLSPNQYLASLAGDNVYSRYITLVGQVENTWLKAPKRVIESTTLASEPDKDGGFSGGIKIISQQAPNFLNDEDEPWTTIDE